MRHPQRVSNLNLYELLVVPVKLLPVFVSDNVKEKCVQQPT
jgi:hypothetical protein